VLTPEARQQLAEMFALALELSAEGRVIYLDRVCAGKPELRRQIEDLLAHDQGEDNLLERPAWEGIASMGNIDKGEFPGPFRPIELLSDGGLDKMFRAPDGGLEPLPASILDQKYRIEKQLGKGAMGTVFRATHIGTTRPVAVKVVAPRLARNPEFVQRFKREAEAAGRLNHPNVVNVTDFGVARVEGGDLAYLVMEYLDGQTLGDYLKDNPRPPFDFLLDVTDQICLALDAAHGAGIVHRDLKPSNVWLEPNHRGGFNVKVLDFGIAKLANPTVQEAAASAEAVETMLMTAPEDDATLALDTGGVQNLLSTPSHLRTTVGTLLGTPTYMSPEQCSGLGVDRSTDIYSLAVIAYQMLCGKVPFEGETLSQLLQLQIQTAPPSPLLHDSGIPQALALVVLSGLEKDPARRPPTAGAFAQRLRAASEGELSLIRKSKDLFHSHLGVFLPVLAACLGSAFVGLAVPARFGAVWVVRSMGAPIGAFLALMACATCLSMLFGFQLFKAACMLILRQASANGHFESTRGPVLRALAAGMGTLLRTQLLSLIDLRPSSFRANLLWPVVWAAEGRSGRDAIGRSRQLCASVPWVSLGLTVRQYGPALVAPLVIAGWMAMIDATGGALRFLGRQALAGTFFGTFMLFYPIVFGNLYLNYGASFSFLYWLSLRCRNESAEIALPKAGREDNRRGAAKTVRPATIVWGVLPLLLLALIITRLNGPSATRQIMEEASDQGRRTALLKLIDSGANARQRISDNGTWLFDAVRNGDGQLVAELLNRGARVNVVERGDGDTALGLAARMGRNDIARLLLDRGASVDAPTVIGHTPLMFAAMRGNLALARLLLERGAVVTRKDNSGKTAADYAFEEGYNDLGVMLQVRHGITSQTPR